MGICAETAMSAAARMKLNPLCVSQRNKAKGEWLLLFKLTLRVIISHPCFVSIKRPSHGKL